MVKLDEVVEFIERTTKKKLYQYQIKFIDNLIHGQITDAPRGCGKSFLIDSYSKYLNYQHDTCKMNKSLADDFISGDEVLDETKLLVSKEAILHAFLINPEKARSEYNIHFTSKYLLGENNG